jgi:hypothetical protein
LIELAFCIGLIVFDVDGFERQVRCGPFLSIEVFLIILLLMIVTILMCPDIVVLGFRIEERSYEHDKQLVFIIKL